MNEIQKVVQQIAILNRRRKEARLRLSEAHKASADGQKILDKLCEERTDKLTELNELLDELE